MTILPNGFITRSLLAVLGVLLLVACGPNAKQRSAAVGRERR